jgi:hypothetical protein
MFLKFVEPADAAKDHQEQRDIAGEREKRGPDSRRL